MNRRFLTMDATRGIAAICVMIFHFPIPILAGSLPSGFVAVDYFFCLSGFVIAHSYGDRFSNGMTGSQFLKLRTIRLYPMYFLGTIMGLVAADVDGQASWRSR